MKIIKLIIHNIGPIEDMTIDFDCALNLFYGKVMQGKTTILNSVKYGTGGSFPVDILTHGKDKGWTEIHWDNAFLKREWYRGKDGKTKARQPIQFVVNGVPQKKPMEAIKLFLNPFLLNQEFFKEKSELERNKYFLELFDIDISDLDKALKKATQDAKDMRVKIAAYGEIDIEPVEEANVEILKTYRTEAIIAHLKKETIIKIENEKIQKQNEIMRKKRERREIIEDRIKELDREATEIGLYLDQNRNTEKDLLQELGLPDTSEIDEKISDAKVQNMKHEQYLVNLKRHEAKEKDRSSLALTEKAIREIRTQKLNRLAKISDSCNIKGLTFDENANAIFEGCTLGMISESQIIRLSSALEALYPPGFGLELLDGAESLGWHEKDLNKIKSVFEFIEKAKEKKSTILATVVSDEPAKIIPDDVGVFIVEKGALK